MQEGLKKRKLYIYIHTHILYTHTVYTMYIHSMCIYTIAVKIVELKSSHHKEKTIFFPIFFFFGIYMRQ